MWGLRFLGRVADRLRGNLAGASGLFDSYRLPVWPRSRSAAPRAALPGLARLLPRVTWSAGARALRDYRADTPPRHLGGESAPQDPAILSRYTRFRRVVSVRSVVPVAHVWKAPLVRADTGLV